MTTTPERKRSRGLLGFENTTFFEVRNVAGHLSSCLAGCIFKGGFAGCEIAGERVVNEIYEECSVEVREYWHACSRETEALSTPDMASDMAYRGTSLIRKRTPLGPYSRNMARALWGS